MITSKQWQKIFLYILVLLLFGVISFEKTKSPKPGAISEFGKYEGYSEEKYNGWERTSKYVTMRDSVKIAIDIIRPTIDGKVEENPLPALLNYYSYLRARMENGKVISMVDRSTSLQTLVRHGYIIAIVDSRGRGASFGQVTGPVSMEEAKDGYDIIEWLASQSWCDSNVGMFGHSYSAHIQLMTASLSPPHLKAIFPSMGAFDLYQLIYPGGILRKIILEMVSKNFKWQDFEAPFIHVDEDVDGVYTAAAREQHRENVDPILMANFPFHDSEGEITKPWTLDNPMSHIKRISSSSIAVYHWAGWFDGFPRDVFQYFRNLKNPQKLVIGPWAHSDLDSTVRTERYKLYTIEQLRWFDYWLKDIVNGIMEEPAILYAVINNPGEYTWHSTNRWPLPKIDQADYYFSGGQSESVSSVNDGGLSVKISADKICKDIYKVDYSTSIGKIHLPRAPIQNLNAPDMTPNDLKSLTYTTPLLDTDVTVIGSPVVTLFVSSSFGDGNFYVYLEEIDNDGKSYLITDGCLRASHRKEAKPPFDNMDLPYHRHFEEDIMPIPEDQPVELKFDLMPLSNIFNKGHRIRVSISCANEKWDEILEEKPVPEITIYRNSQLASKITLPVISN
ncbi:CocE/NonD family hydrolase [candidate division KSB1 bacterium]|nr:CocE/NonD family hydrolase [candidate division KSB1 bacterium]